MPIAELLADVAGIVLQEDPLEELAFIALGFFGGLYLVYDGFDTWKMARLMEDTPTEKVRSMAVGRTELKGTVREHETVIDPPYGETGCVYIDWKAERREKRTDDDGNTHYVWKTVASDTRALSFYLEDDTGRVLVRADLDTPEFDINDGAHSRRVKFGRGESPPPELLAFMSGEDPAPDTAEDDDGGLWDTVTDAFDGSAPLSRTGKRRRYSQTVLPAGTDVYLFGGAEPREGSRMESSQADLLQMVRHDGTGEFLVSDSSEDELRSQYSRLGPTKAVLGIGLSAVALYFFLVRYLAL